MQAWYKYDSIIYMTPMPSYNMKKKSYKNHNINSAQSWRSIQWSNIQKTFQSWKGKKCSVFISMVCSVSLTSWHCARYPDLCDYCSVSSSPLPLFLFVEVCPAQGWWVFRKQSKKWTRTIQNSWAKCYIKITQSHIQIFKDCHHQANPFKPHHAKFDILDLSGSCHDTFTFTTCALRRRYSFESIIINNLGLIDRENSSKEISNFTILKKFFSGVIKWSNWPWHKFMRV